LPSNRIRTIGENSARARRPSDSFASNSTPTQSDRGRWGYLALFGMQTIGAVVLFWTGLLLYRQVLADPSHEPELWPIVGSLSSITLMQIAYWVSYRVRPPLPQFQNALLGHAILFLARMVNVLPTAIFGFVFVGPKPTRRQAVCGSKTARKANPSVRSDCRLSSIWNNDAPTTWAHTSSPVGAKTTRLEASPNIGATLQGLCASRCDAARTPTASRASPTTSASPR
jgi:hypothetical protein